MRYIKLGLALVTASLFSLSATASASDDVTVRNESPFIARVYLYTLHEQLVSSGTVPYVTTSSFRTTKNGLTAKMMRVYLYEGMEGRQHLCIMFTLLKPGDLNWEITSRQHVRNNSDCYLHRA